MRAKGVGINGKRPCLLKQLLSEGFELFKRYEAMIDQEPHVLEVCFKTTIHLAQGNTVRVKNVDGQPAVLTDQVVPSGCAFRQWNEFIEGYRLNFELHLVRHLLDSRGQRSNRLGCISANVINVERGPMVA